MFAGQLNCCAVLKVRGVGSEREASLRKVSGDDSWRAPPVPIPNTEVKPPNADGTELGTAWESRKLPGSKRSGRNESFSRSQNIRKNGAARRRAEAGRAAKPRQEPKRSGPKAMCEAEAVAKAERKSGLEADGVSRRQATSRGTDPE